LVENSQVQGASVFDLAQYQTSDQIAGDNIEDVNSDESARN